MNVPSVIIIALTVALLVFRLSKDIHSGMRWLFGLLVFLPTSIRIELPGALPQLTVHRILLLVAFVFLFSRVAGSKAKEATPHLALVISFCLWQFLSAVFGMQAGEGFKAGFDYLIEVVIFYILASKYSRLTDDCTGVLSAFCYGLAAVAGLAFIEKYLRINLFASILPVGSAEFAESGDIVSTYPHRILLGYAMAMGIPLALALGAHSRERSRKRLMHLILLLLIGAAYFSNSRGPWLGVVLAIGAMAALGGAKARRAILGVAVLSAVVLIVLPGVKESIWDLAAETVDPDSVKGDSYQARWQLWRIAWAEISRSPERFLFGYGRLSTEHMDLNSKYYEGEGAQANIIKIGHTSWDNHYACDLIECGLVGLAVELILFTAVAALLFQKWREGEPPGRDLMAGILVACLVFMFAMTNVFIFAPQLTYLFWALVGIGSRRAALVSNEPNYGAATPQPCLESGPW